MDVVSISELKMRPSKIISKAFDFPVAVQSRNRIKAYLIGKELYEKIVTFIEDYIDKVAIRKTDFSRGRDFEKVAKELGI